MSEPGLGAVTFADPHRHGPALLQHWATVPATAAAPEPAARHRDPAALDLRVAGAGTTWTLPALLRRTHATSLLVRTRDEVLLEWYAEPHGPSTLFLGASMTKSVLACLVGVAVAAGRLDLEARAGDLVPELAAGGYARTTVRQVAAMTSGVAWQEDYRSPDSPARRLLETFARGGGGSRALVAGTGPEDQPGTRFRYCTADSQALDWVREAATGLTYRDALAGLWRDLGCGTDAVVGLDAAAGTALAGGGLAATTRDWARIGLLQLDGHGSDDAGPPLLDQAWREASSAPSYPFTRPGRLPSTITTHAGFGLHWWPLDDAGRTVAADGSRGQFTLVDRDRGVVVVQTSAWPYDEPTDRQCRDLCYLALPSVAAAAADWSPVPRPDRGAP